MKRIGFACHYVILKGNEKKMGMESFDRPFVMKTTTRAYLKRLAPVDALQHLHSCVEHNLDAIVYLIQKVGSMPDNQKMLRISSDVLPLYTAPDPVPQEYYASMQVRQFLSKKFAEIGDLVRAYGVKISFHPSQWTVLGSDRPDVIKNSLEYIEYHAYMITLMGFAKKFADVKCNIHLGGKGGERQFLKAYYQLSPEARRVLTVENTEFGSGTLENCLKLRKHLPIVLDIHHHLIASNGQYINPDDHRVRKVEESWYKTEVRPTMHFSWLVESSSYGLDINQLPDYEYLSCKHTDTLLRKHSMTYYNLAARDWALSFLDRFDIMCEAKAKSVASTELYHYAQDKGFI